MFEKKSIFATALIVTSLLLNTTVFCAQYYDIDAADEEYDAILTLAEKGVMVGDSNGNYNPDLKIDKFYASKILAKLAGFKYVDATESESVYFERAYQANKDIIEKFETDDEFWDNSANREIAYLLEREIIDLGELDDFTYSGGSEIISKQQYLTWLARLIDKGGEAENFEIKDVFADDDKIKKSYRQSVYYVCDKIGEEASEDVYFEPNKRLAKAETAQITAAALPFLNIAESDDKAEIYFENINPKSSANIIETIPCSIYAIYPKLNVAQLKTADGLITTYALSPSRAVYINNRLKTIQDIENGAKALCSINNSQITEIRVLDNKADAADIRLSIVEGVITEFKEGKSLKTVAIETENGKEFAYCLDENCEIYFNGGRGDFADLAEGYKIVGSVAGNAMYKAEIYDALESARKATVIGKTYNPQSGDYELKTEDSDGKITSIFADEDSVFKTIFGQNVKSASDIFIGDVISFTADDGKIISLALEERKTGQTEGYIDSVFISGEESVIAIRESADEKLEAKKFYINAKDFFNYNLSVDSKARFVTVGDEIISLKITKKATAPRSYAQGYVYTIGENYINISDSPDGKRYTRIYIDDDAGFSKNGKETDFQSISRGDKARICIRTEGNRMFANSVTIQ